MSNPEKLDIFSPDGVRISADFYSADNPRGWVIYIHMMPSDKRSWSALAERLQSEGYPGIAVDLRGHGESDGGPDGYRNFSDNQHQAGISDIEAAWKFLKSKGASMDKLTVIGASIGANLSLQFSAGHPEIFSGIFLSPGNYKGIDSLELVKKISPEQKILFVASEADERAAGNNADQNRIYFESAPQVKNKKLIVFRGAGHGTDLFSLEKEYNLIEGIVKFIKYGSIE